ncbi:hypothetical protein BsWGS_04373 [Bradybaena similaris]
MDSGKTSEDIQTDAQMDPEDNDHLSSSQVLPNESVLNLQSNGKKSSDASFSNQSTLPESSSLSSSRSLLFAQTARPITSADNNEYLKYKEQMPDSLREENIDILIVNAESDKKAAAGFQNHLTKDILFYIHGQPRRPRVKLLDEVRHGSMDNLDFAFSKALYVFLYVTRDFCDEPWTLLRGQACLTEAIHDKNKQWCVVPIHTTSRRSQYYKLPMMLNSLRAITYLSGNQDQFYIEGVRKLLESKTGLLLERERLLDEARQAYFKDNRVKLLENERYKDKGLYVCRSNLSHQALASDYSPVTYPATSEEFSSKPSAVCTSSTSDGDVYQTNVCRHSSFADASDKALPDVSLAMVTEGMEAIAVSEHVAVDADNDLHVNVRYSANDRSSQRPNQEAARQLMDRNSEISQRIPYHVSDRSHDRQSQVTTQQSQNSAVNEAVISIEHSRNISNSVTREEDSIEVDGPSSFTAQENRTPQFYPHRPVPTVTPSSLHPNISAANSVPQNVPNQIVTQDHPATSRMVGHRNYHMNSPDFTPRYFHPVPNISSAANYVPQNVPNRITTPDHPATSSVVGHGNYHMNSPAFMPRYFHPVPQPAFYPYDNYYPHPHLYPSYPQHYLPMQAYTLQDLYTYANPIPPPSFYEMRSQSQTSLLASNNDSTHTSLDANAPDSVRSDLSHSSSTGALSAFGSLPVLSSHWPVCENLSYNNEPFHPQPVSSRHCPTSDPRISQPVEGAPATTVQHPQPHTPVPVPLRNLDASYFETGQRVAAAEIPSSEKSGRTFSAGPNSAATSSVIQHIHHHHHKKNITVTRATNLLIGDKSQILNKHSVDVISDDESGDDNDAEDDTEEPASRSGPLNSTR